MSRCFLLPLTGMDELIEHLQINLGKDFGYEDDVVVEKLRDVMHELRSSRLDHAGNNLFVEIRFVGIYVSIKFWQHICQKPCQCYICQETVAH